QSDQDALEHLIKRYKPFVKAKARSYFLVGADKDDVVQEGMIGLYKAIRNFNEDKLTTFRVFAELCITRHMITAIKMATRQKHIPLNSYISLDKPMYEDESDRTLLDIISEVKTTDPASMLITQEDLALIELKVNEILSNLEKDVLELYLDGRTYQEISVLLNRHVKSIDNALQRIKKKMEKFPEFNAYSL
ncbi:MAG: RNA polymerase sporulation sigma factor SigH, partial [Bacilli bacterium]